MRCSNYSDPRFRPRFAPRGTVRLERQLGVWRWRLGRWERKRQRDGLTAS
jgi:hypothetical protein